ncbi:MAG TPA: ribosome maturation factor RimM [Dehalococcoidia bacterium]|nr:ribosome maturation factor RimM [Dehalococcoidia bacterium]
MASGPFSKSANNPAADIPDGFVAVGRVRGAFGVRGDLKVKPMAPPQTFAPGRSLTLAGEAHKIERSRPHKDTLLLKLTGIETPEDAAALSQAYLLLPESELEPLGDDEYYRYQLIGLRVVSTEGEDLGEITEVLDRPANDVFVVKGSHGEILIPAADDIVQTIDLETRTMTIEVVPGLLP